MEWLTPTTVISSLAALVTLLLGLWVKAILELFRRNETANNDRFNKLEAATSIANTEAMKMMSGLVDKSLNLANNFANETKNLSDRLHKEEIATVEVRGELKLAAQINASVTGDIDSIRETMVTRKEWEARMDHMEGLLEKLLESSKISHCPTGV